MCGLAGYFNLGGAAFTLDQTLLDAMQRSLAHRGPDGYRIWVSAEHELALVHRRLSIIDISDAGTQPMFDQERTVVICVNGEIYNYQELKKELEVCGHHFSSASDSEVILHGYKQWGMDQLLERLRGMFAFCLYDLITGELFLVRDRMGIKPLYFSLQGGICSFASEIKALWQLPWVNKQLSKEGVYHYLTYLVTPAPLTIFAEVYKIPAGFYLRFDKYKQMHICQWYVLHEKLGMRNDLDEQEYIQQLRILLRASVKSHMISDVPMGVFLSGGVDSSLNVALMAECSSNVKTFTIAFSDGPEYNELAWARKVANQFGTDHHEIIIDESDAYRFFDDMIYYQDEPLGDCVCVPVYFVSKLLKDAGVTVVQVGEGADELFCGYDQYARYLDMYQWWQQSQRYIPAYVRKTALSIMEHYAPEKHNRLDIMHNWAYNKELFHSGAVVFSEYSKRQMLGIEVEKMDVMTDCFFKGMRLTDSYAMSDWYRVQLKARMPDVQYTTQIGYLDVKHRLPELLLMRVDKMSMAVGVEARVPFLDHTLVEFALSLPEYMKYRNGQTKYILKKVAQEMLPHNVVYRKKVGFAAPTTRWFKKSNLFNELLQDLLAQPNELASMLDIKQIKQMQARNRTDTSVDYSYHLWAIQNLFVHGVQL